jgi:ketosteroid isomerase-like protein
VQRGAMPLTSHLACPLKPVPHDPWGDGDRAATRFDAPATMTSGAPYHDQYGWIFRMKDGEVV